MSTVNRKPANGMAAAPPFWEIRSFDDVNRFWSSVRLVPGRTLGRQHWHEERYYVGLYLLALATHQLLDYPFHVEQGESPDFVFTWPSGDVAGLEVTKMTTQWLQQAMTDDEREYLSRETAAAASGSQPEPVVRSLDDGLLGDEAEAKWCALFREAVERKLGKLPGFRPASRHDLLISDDTPPGDVDRRKVVTALRPWVRGLDTPKLGTIAVVISIDVVFDLRGRPRLLPAIVGDLERETDGPRFMELLSELEGDPLTPLPVDRRRRLLAEVERLMPIAKQHMHPDDYARVDDDVARLRTEVAAS